MHVHHLLNNNSIANKFIAQLRDTSIQNDRMRFRRNIERLGEILSYELSKKLNYSSEEITSPLGISKVSLPKNEIVICSILRAGLPLHTGILNYFDDAENSFISAYRHHPNDDKEFEIKVEYLASPSIEGKTLVLADPMLATGRSFVNVMHALKEMGTPKEIHLVAVIGAEEGLKLLDDEFPPHTHLWIAAIDKELDSRGYIVPGLGDAGDLCFGNKKQH
ncbi:MULTISPECIES: uracil phosphoribosyltransferase [unclassified Zunongwangia]|uniref:uracil phosphoribosyltransferase n=1 Tax=unclassified Zunongwangia TaxID=2632541 RepID=UPI0022DD6B01|nr:MULTISPECIES: uracil phosphoribosyltransferase [unclassified Zunongwangia]WBL20926.1 uracil phosphoribosyltransferase [Zunongwangia sp. HRR-M8]WBL27196.1 uracil phosphoribosyltransferase [Zunongwangia sp. HGR-M22]